MPWLTSPARGSTDQYDLLRAPSPPCGTGPHTGREGRPRGYIGGGKWVLGGGLLAARETAAAEVAANLPVLAGEDPWTVEEIAQVRAELVADRDRLRASIAQNEAELAELMNEGSDGAGRDPADVGSSNFERDQEVSLHNNQLAMLDQIEQALRMLDDGTYGVCENCGEPIGKLRLEVFPRATMCVSCKQRQERR